jgi:cobalt-zinc-cadmium efflux system membrane fusion protein
MKRIASLLLAALCAAAGCSRAVDEHAHEEAGYERGPHGGRWLEDGDFALELAISAEGVPPEYRAYVYRADKAVDPAGVSLEVTLRRFGGRVDVIGFAPRGAYLVGERSVEEPHSFDVEVVARADGREHRFAFSSYENRVTLDSEQLAAGGIALREAGSATIRERVALNGRIAANEDALAHVMPRFPGIVRSVHARLGERVEKGARLAVVESNESLHPYELRAPLSGSVIRKDVVAGEFVPTDRVLFEIADLNTVWADLDVYRRDFGRLQVGQAVAIDAGDGSPPESSTLAYLAPVGALNTQTLLARAVLPNPDGAWRPGMFVTAQVEVAAAEVPVAVELGALQRLRDRDVVFVSVGNVFEAQPVELGRRDATHVEVLSGIAPGQAYAASGSFLLKAEAGKSGAEHEH